MTFKQHTITMHTQDDFTLYHKDLLDGHYDCVDRIVLNGYFPMGQQGGGFRTWWRNLNGCDDNLDQKHLQQMAGPIKDIPNPRWPTPRMMIFRFE